jgi:hypothetical protein
MDRLTRIRVWDALADPPRFIYRGKLETAISLGVAGIHPSSCDWDIEFGTGHKDKAGVEVFQGDIVRCVEWCNQNYVVRYGQKWWPFGDSRDGIDDEGGHTVGFYLEPVPRGTRRKGDEHDRPLPWADDGEVIGNIHEAPELLEVKE